MLTRTVICVNRPKEFGISLVLANCMWCFLVDRCLTADFQSFMNPAVLMSAQVLRSKRLKMGTTIAYGSRVLFCLFVLCPFGSVMKRKEESLACDIECSISFSQMRYQSVKFPSIYFIVCGPALWLSLAQSRSCCWINSLQK